MKTFDVLFDREVFSHDVVLRAAHRHSELFAVALTSTSSEWIVGLSPLGDGDVPDDIRQRLLRDVLDEQLRESVRNQTAGLQVALIEAALHGAKPALVGR